MLIEIKKLHYNAGNLRQYYQYKNTLLCRFIDPKTKRECVDEWFMCSKDYEPSHPIKFRPRIRIKFI